MRVVCKQYMESNCWTVEKTNGVRYHGWFADNVACSVSTRGNFSEIDLIAQRTVSNFRKNNVERKVRMRLLYLLGYIFICAPFSDLLEKKCVVSIDGGGM